jgi:hypothetical protein
LLVHRPCTVFWLSLFLAFVLSAVPFIFYDIFEIDFTTDNFKVRGNDIANKYHAMTLATQGVGGLRENRRRLREDDNWESGASCHQWSDIYFQTRDGGNIFTAANIAEAGRLQAAFLQLPGVNRVHFSTVTALQAEPDLPAAVARLAQAASDRDWSTWGYWTQDCPAWVRPGTEICTPSPHGQQHNENAMRDWAESENGPPAYFAKEFSACNATSTVLRAKAEICVWSLEEKQALYDRVDDLNDDAEGDVRLVTRDREFDNWQQEQQMIAEAGWLGGVMALVVALILAQTRSFFVTAMGFIEIVLTFPLGYFFYRVVAGVEYFHFLNLLGLFIMLGIGADDIFVLNDAWKQSALLFGRGDLERRMEWAIAKSSRSIFTTSFTTAVAFFGNLVSHIPPLKYFGLMTGCQVCRHPHLDFPYVTLTNRIVNFSSNKGNKHRWSVTSR